MGLGQVFQVVDGAQQGVRIHFRNPLQSSFPEEFSIPADLNGVTGIAVVPEVWITWPESADARSIVLRTYTAGSGPATPSQQTLASVREERIIFYADGLTFPTGTAADLFGFRSVDTFVSPALELVHRRRFTRLQFWAELEDTSPSIAPYTMALRLRGTPTGTSIDGRRWSNRIHGVPLNNNTHSLYGESPIPLTAWKLRFTNPGAGTITLGVMVSETT